MSRCSKEEFSSQTLEIPLRTEKLARNVKPHLRSLRVMTRRLMTLYEQRSRACRPQSLVTSSQTPRRCTFCHVISSSHNVPHRAPHCLHIFSQEAEVPRQHMSSFVILSENSPSQDTRCSGPGPRPRVHRGSSECLTKMTTHACMNEIETPEGLWRKTKGPYFPINITSPLPLSLYLLLIKSTNERWRVSKRGGRRLRTLFPIGRCRLRSEHF